MYRVSLSVVYDQHMVLCEPWLGRINADGYGTIGRNLAHRVAYERERGPIPDGMTLDHTCHDPEVCHAGRDCPHRRCVNVDHLEPATPAANASRSSKRHATTEHCPKGHRRGRRDHCPTCRAERSGAARASAREARCADAGHEPDLVADARGRTACRLCRTGGFAPRDTCKNGHDKGPGRCPICVNDRQRASKRARALEKCAQRGHSPDLATMTNGKVYCKTCRMDRPGRPARAV